MLSMIGVSVFILLFGGILWANARRWRYLSSIYGGPTNRPLEQRRMQSAVLLGLGGFNSLKGLLLIGVEPSGVSFRVLPPFSLFHAPFFVPYADIRGWDTSWYLDARSTELEFSRAPGIKMVMPAEQAEWIGSFAGHRMILNEACPPKGKAGRGWHAVALVHASISLIMIAWLAVQLIP